MGRKKIVMVAGTPSHGPGDHEFNAGTMLLKKWPGRDAQHRGRGLLHRLAGRSHGVWTMPISILLYMDGGSGHPVIQRNRLAEIDQLMKRRRWACAVPTMRSKFPRKKVGPI